MKTHAFAPWTAGSNDIPSAAGAVTRIISLQDQSSKRVYNSRVFWPQVPKYIHSLKIYHVSGIAELQELKKDWVSCGLRHSTALSWLQLADGSDSEVSSKLSLSCTNQCLSQPYGKIFTRCLIQVPCRSVLEGINIVNTDKADVCLSPQHPPADRWLCARFRCN